MSKKILQHNGFIEKEKLEEAIVGWIDNGRKVEFPKKKIKTHREKRKQERKKNPHSRKRVVLINHTTMRP